MDSFCQLREEEEESSFLLGFHLQLPFHREGVLHLRRRSGLSPPSAHTSDISLCLLPDPESTGGRGGGGGQMSRWLMLRSEVCDIKAWVNMRFTNIGFLQLMLMLSDRRCFVLKVCDNIQFLDGWKLRQHSITITTATGQINMYQTGITGVFTCSLNLCV